MKLKKRLLVSVLAATLLAPAALATVENTTGTTITASAAKAKHHKKTKKAKKHTKKKTTKKEPKQTATNQTTTQPTQTTTQQPDDYQTYNDAVSSLGQYANPANLTSFKVGAGTRFATGSRQDIVNSLNDMTSNMGNSDAYDLQMYGNSAAIAFQQQALQLYQNFKNRFSSYDDTQLTNDVNTIQQHWISSTSAYSDTNAQWTNLKNFMNDLSNAFQKLGN